MLAKYNNTSSNIIDPWYKGHIRHYNGKYYVVLEEVKGRPLKLINGCEAVCNEKEKSS